MWRGPGVSGRAGGCGQPPRRELDILLYGVPGWEWNIFVGCACSSNSVATRDDPLGSSAVWSARLSISIYLSIPRTWDRMRVPFVVNLALILCVAFPPTYLRELALPGHRRRRAPPPLPPPPRGMEPAACKHLNDLPDELLQQIMLAMNVQAAVACAQACSTWASLVRSEELWEALCVASWPLVHRLPRPAYSSWRLCHRSRCSGTIPGTWRKLLPLYDESALLAIERPGGWIGRLGAVLLRIRSIRKLHGLNTWPRVGARGSRSGVSLALKEEEGLSWLHSVHNALSRAQAAEELLAFAGGAPPELPSDREETEEEDAMRMPHRARTPD